MGGGGRFDALSDDETEVLKSVSRMLGERILAGIAERLPPMPEGDRERRAAADAD